METPAPSGTPSVSGRWVILCTAAGLTRVFLADDGRLIDAAAPSDIAGPASGSGEAGSGTSTHDPALVCPYSVLAGAAGVAGPPDIPVPTRYFGVVPVFPTGSSGHGGTVLGPPLGARAPPV